MMKHIVFVVIILSLFILLYSLSQKEYIPFPSDENHISITKEEMCLDCHSEGGEYPRKKEHPPKEQCLRCHEVMKPDESSKND